MSALGELPESEEDGSEYPRYHEAPPPDGALAAGDPPEGHSSRSTGNRIWQLRYEEMCEKAGITLPGGSVSG